MLSPLLGALELKCNNTAYRPVMAAIDLLQRYPEQPLKERAFSCQLFFRATGTSRPRM